MQIIRVVSICKARTSHIPWYITYEGEQKLLCGGKHIGPALSTFNFERIVFVFDHSLFTPKFCRAKFMTTFKTKPIQYFEATFMWTANNLFSEFENAM